MEHNSNILFGCFGVSSISFSRRRRSKTCSEACVHVIINTFSIPYNFSDAEWLPSQDNLQKYGAFAKQWAEEAGQIIKEAFHYKCTPDSYSFTH